MGGLWDYESGWILIRHLYVVRCTVIFFETSSQQRRVIVTNVTAVLFFNEVFRRYYQLSRNQFPNS